MTKSRFAGQSGKSFLSQTSALFGVAAFAALLAPSGAFAQDTPPEEDDEAIVVTGTRIHQPDFEFSNPVASVDAQAIQQSGATNLTDFAQDMPALLNSFDSEESADTGNGGGLQGQNLLDLRGLGFARTLVLVDGRRHVAGVQGTNAVDINTIPIDLVQRVEVLTGGASAVYGADGVTGVVNFVMRDDFEGLIARGQYGWLDQGGGGDEFLSLLWGTNFAGNRGNFTVAAEWSNAHALDFNERDYIASGNAEFLLDDPLYGTPGHDFQNIPTRNARYIDTSRGGSFMTDCDGDYGSFFACWTGTADPGSLTGMDYTGNGAAWVDGPYVGSAFMQGGSGSPAEDFNDQLLPDLQRYTINLRAHYDLNNYHRLVGEFKWAHTETYFVGQPTYEFGTFISMDNPYMPMSIRNAANAPDGLGTYYGGIFMFRDNFDLGTLDQAVERDTLRTVIALQGDVTPNINYELSFVWGQTEAANRYHTRNNERWFAAIDVVDNGSGPECFDNSGGETWAAGTCVPINVFGEGNISQAGIDWIMTDLNDTETTSQGVLTGFVSGDSSDWFELPAGPIGFAIGAEYREEESEFDYDDSLAGLSAPEDIFWNGQGVDSDGRYDVIEAFAEIELPLLRDLPFAEELTLDAAYRISEYSSVGDTDAWKIGLRYRPTDWLMFRGTVATAVRAPNISELYSPNQITFGTTGDTADPCDTDAVNAGTPLRPINCAAAFAALGVPYDPNTYQNTTSTTIPGHGGGNVDLRAESADTTTYGFVVDAPGVLEGLSFSVDWWEIELTDAIQLLTVAQIAAYCYDFAQPNQYCPLIERTPVGIPSLAIPAGGLSDFTTTYLNVAAFNTAGIDFGIRYHLDPSDWGVDNIGQFQFALNATKLETWEFQDSALSPPILFVGTPGTPDWQAVFDATWNIGNWTVNYGYSWFSETDRYSDATVAADPDIAAPEYLKWSERSVHDIYVAYDFENRVRIYGGINNFTEQLPDRASTRGPYPVNEVGRAFYMGVRAQF